MKQQDYTKQINHKINQRDFTEIENLIYPLVDLCMKKKNYEQALTTLNLMGEVLMLRGYSFEEKILLEKKKISVYNKLGLERDVLLSLKLIAETYKMFDDDLYIEKLKECLEYYEGIEEKIPSDKEYLLGTLLDYYKRNNIPSMASNIIKDIIKHKTINGIQVTLSNYYDCLCYADNDKTRDIIRNNITYIINNKSYEISMTEIIAMKELTDLCNNLKYTSTEKLLINEINEILSQQEYSFYQDFI